MSYFAQIKIIDEEGNVVDSYDIREMGSQMLMSMILVELKRMNLHLESITGERISENDLT